ncbi:uncharacterized protein LOC132639424 [Lycium barbarum]|uniref:uncharacterized protein LOC132639424 n=1 Tax=Lycium barbarum TaxID=112863 RepID=UPI00293F22AF|nr:uncharacterized protein LOC132639424 [Lycium barbarum]
MWVKGLPYKIAFTMWRVWHFKVPLDEVIRSWGYNLSSKCLYCTAESKEETIAHIFMRCQTAQRTWSYFSSAAGFDITGIHSQQVMLKWWGVDVKPRMQAIYNIVPSIIVWELWKKRNGDKHNNKVTDARVIYQASTLIQQLVRLRKPGIQHVPHRWPEILQILESFVPRLKVTKVLWEFLVEGVWKCNIDGATRGNLKGVWKCNTDGATRVNPGRSSYAFCVRTHNGDLVHPCAKEMQEGTNTESEVKALLEATRFCLSKHVYSFILETDSMLMKMILEREWKPPWNIVFMVEELWDIMDNGQVQLLHILREGNKLADHLAN